MKEGKAQTVSTRFSEKALEISIDEVLPQARFGEAYHVRLLLKLCEAANHAQDERRITCSAPAQLASPYCQAVQLGSAATMT